MKALNDMYVLLDNWSTDSPELLTLHARRHLTLYLALAKDTMVEGRGWTRWRFYPKHHMLLHIAAQSHKFGNPKLHWDYTDEDAIGMCADIAESVHINTLSVACRDKYRVWVQTIVLDKIKQELAFGS